MRYPCLHTDPGHQPPEIPNILPDRPEIQPSPQPQPEIPEPPADPIVPEPGHAPEIEPNQSPTEIPAPGPELAEASI